LKQSALLKQLINEGKTEKQAMIALVKAISVIKPNVSERNTTNYVSVTFSAESPNIAQKALQKFIDFINHDVRQTMAEDLVVEIESKINTLKIKKESLKLFSDTALDVRLKNLEKAYLIAKNAGIKEYSKIHNGALVIPSNVGSEVGVKLKDSRLSDDGFLFMLGENYLLAQINVLKGNKVIYPEAYYQASLKIDLLSDLLSNKENLIFDTFHYQSSPSFPLQRDKPRRALIVLIGTFSGGVLGILVALFMTALEARKTRLR
ncbi:MAG: chain length determination protein, partial [Gammaproteobacteria bacterium]